MTVKIELPLFHMQQLILIDNIRSIFPIVSNYSPTFFEKQTKMYQPFGISKNLKQ